MCLPVKEHIITHSITKGIEPESNQASGSSCQSTGNIKGKKRVKLLCACSIKISRLWEILQVKWTGINNKYKRGHEEGTLDEKQLKNIMIMIKL